MTDRYADARAEMQARLFQRLGEWAVADDWALAGELAAAGRALQAARMNKA